MNTFKVFVYGSLKDGFSNHHVLKGSSFLGQDKTLLADFHMFSMGGFPGVVLGKCYISGELYEVDDEGLKKLDMLESNGSFYTREIVEMNGGENAWMYLLRQNQYVDEANEHVAIDGGVHSWSPGVVVEDTQVDWVEKAPSGPEDDTAPDEPEEVDPPRRRGEPPPGFYAPNPAPPLPPNFFNNGVRPEGQIIGEAPQVNAVAVDGNE